MQFEYLDPEVDIDRLKQEYIDLKKLDPDIRVVIIQHNIETIENELRNTNSPADYLKYHVIHPPSEHLGRLRIGPGGANYYENDYSSIDPSQIPRLNEEFRLNLDYTKNFYGISSFSIKTN